MNKKVELVLNELIKNYLKIHQPISSTYLKELAQLSMSPSTIRGYFQILEKMGMIEKEHFASGSYPSTKAMEYYWRENLPINIKNFSIEILKEKCEEFNIVAFIKIFENQVLNEVYNVNNKFIVLEFENDETVIKYEENLFNLLKSFKYLNLKELLKFFKHYNLNQLIKNVKNFKKTYIINQKLLYNNFSEVNFEFLNQVNKFFINYDKKFIIRKYEIDDNKKEIDIYLIGNIYSDFIKFFDSMKGGENGKTS